MADAARNPDSYITYNDYLEIDDGNRYEVLNGELYMMASPSSIHQQIVVEVLGQLRNALMGKPCKPFVSPMDVRLFYKEDGSDDTVVQPDVFVVCDKSKIGKNSINGAPDFVVEVLSPSNSWAEISLKQSKYALSGVKEYWMFDYEHPELIKYELVDGVFKGDRKPLEGVENVGSLGISLDLSQIVSVINL
jgi:Uma2 family endonuclease